MIKSWHTRQERRVIRKYGGTPLIKYGYDGKINGRPVEVRSVKKGKRYRIQKDVHKYLIRHGGAYIFVNKRGRSVKVPAGKVSKKIGRGKWFKDRKYPHKFLRLKQIFKKRK